MHFQSELCHIEGNKAIVRVSAWNGEEILGSTLSEAPTVEIAEEKGIQKLLERLRVKQHESKQELNVKKNSQYNKRASNNNESLNEPLTEEKNVSLNLDLEPEPEEWS